MKAYAINATSTDLGFDTLLLLCHKILDKILKVPACSGYICFPAQESKDSQSFQNLNQQLQMTQTMEPFN